MTATPPPPPFTSMPIKQDSAPMAKHYPFKLSSELKRDIAKSVKDAVERIDNIGFTVWPCNPDPDHGLPVGWFTIGMTRVGLPEFYVSGMAPYGREAEEIVGRLRRLFEISKNLNTITNNAELCREVNTKFAETFAGNEHEIPYQWRPIDTERLTYGQGMMIRWWAEHEEIGEIVQGIQIVRRDQYGNFPMHDTPDQLLLEWAPFGTKYTAAE